MGHTFLFRSEPKGRCDSLDWWLSILSADAMLLSEAAGGSRSLAKLSESLETLAVERRRKGRETYRERAVEQIEKLAACTAAMTAERGHARIYPSLARHLEKKTQYALRLTRQNDAPLVCGASAMKEVSFGLSLVSDTAQLCPQYLDPSERMMMKKACEMREMLEDKRSRAFVCEMGRGGCLPFLAEADEAVTEYRRFLRELSARAEEKRLSSVFPPSFLVWADGTCALVHRLLKRLISGKSVLGVAEEEEAVSSDEVMRTAPLMPMTILAEHSGAEAVREELVTEEVAAEGETAFEKVPAEKEVCEECAEGLTDEVTTELAVIEVPALPVPPAEEVLAQKDGSPAFEKIYAKASDYKNVVEKAVKKSRENSARMPRPLGKRR